MAIKYIKIKEDEHPILIRKKLSGVAPKKDSEERNYRKALKLPVTKDLIYYDITKNFREHPVRDFWIEKIWDISDEWFTLKLFTDEKEILIHSGFFAEMQHPAFIRNYKDMALESLLDTWSKGRRW